MDPLSALAGGARTALGFFWKSGWAFVPRARLTRHFSFAALSAARTLVLKGGDAMEMHGGGPLKRAVALGAGTRARRGSLDGDAPGVG